MKTLLALFLATAALTPVSFAQVSQDSSANYTSATWTNGSSQGFGFGAWQMVSGQGTGFAGTFIAPASSAGIGGMSASSFGLYANPANTGAYVRVGRNFSSALAPGQAFTFLMGMNWDSGDPNGAKGFNLYTGGVGTNEVININMQNTAAITINGNPMFSQYGTNAMTLSLEMVAPLSLRVSGIGRNGVETFDQTFVLTAAPDSFAFYAANMAGGAERQLYFDNLTVVPEPSTIALISMSALGLFGYRVRSRLRCS